MEQREMTVTVGLLDKPPIDDTTGATANGTQSEHTATSYKGSLTWRLAIAVFACVIGSSFQFGYHVGVLNNPRKILQNEFKYGFTSEELGLEESNLSVSNYSITGQLSNDQTLILWSVTVSIFGAGGLLAGITGGYLANKFGRKTLMLANNVLMIGAATCMISAKFAKALELMIVGRLLHGINCGYSTLVAPLYLNEISPVNLRGGVGVIHTLAIMSGIFISQALGLRQLFGSIDLYYLLFGVPVVAGILQLLILPFCPESPSWLYITQQKQDKSREAVQFFGEAAFNVDQQLELYEVELDVKQTHFGKVSCCDMITKSYLRTPLLIAVVMQLSLQWSGIIPVLNYSTSIFKSTGLTEGDSQYATVGTSAVILLMTFVSVLFMDKVGRRPLHLIGLSGCLISMIIITAALFIQEEHGWAKYLSVASLVLFILSFASGPGSIPWFITAELFDQEARPYAISIATAFNWGAHSISALLFPIMQERMKSYCFVPYIILLVSFVAFTFFKVPETKNKSTEEIVSMFRQEKQNLKTFNQGDDSVSEMNKQ